MNIRERILARTDLAPLLAVRDLDGLAAALNEQPEMASHSTFVTARALLAKCEHGAEILAALEAAASANIAIAYAVKFLGQDAGLDIGPACDKLLAKLVPGVLSAAYVAEIKALSLQPVYVTRLQVEAEMFKPE